MANNKEVRINKIVKDFNIGISTLVEFLNKKGFDVEAIQTPKFLPKPMIWQQRSLVKSSI